MSYETSEYGRGAQGTNDMAGGNDFSNTRMQGGTFPHPSPRRAAHMLTTPPRAGDDFSNDTTGGLSGAGAGLGANQGAGFGASTGAGLGSAGTGYGGAGAGLGDDTFGQQGGAGRTQGGGGGGFERERNFGAGQGSTGGGDYEDIEPRAAVGAGFDAPGAGQQGGEYGGRQGAGAGSFGGDSARDMDGGVGRSEVGGGEEYGQGERNTHVSKMDKIKGACFLVRRSEAETLMMDGWVCRRDGEGRRQGVGQPGDGRAWSGAGGAFFSFRDASLILVLTGFVFVQRGEF
jgi:hypothetical protein